MFRVIILGSGPAGLTAALYTARANLEPLVLEGHLPGGQLTLTTTIENFPGFPDGVEAWSLMGAMKQQVIRYGAVCRPESAVRVDLKKRPFEIETDKDTYRSHALIVATGATARMLGLESEKALLGKGVSTCATCDGAFFRDKAVVVVGGGDSALEEAMFLTRFASSVTLVHRRDQLRATRLLQDRALRNEKIRFVWNSVIKDILDPAQGRVSGVVLEDVKTQKTRYLPCDGVFIAIGHTPNTELFADQLELKNGYIVTTGQTQTSVPGVFAAGDVQDMIYRQAVTAAGSGCMAALDCEKWLTEAGHL
ncbi:MAG: thioredoxin-disulfide reductase [Limnochordia bacterium]